MLAHKTRLHKLKKIEIIKYIFSDHSGKKLEISYKETSGNKPNKYKLNNIHLNDEWVIPRIKEEIKKKTQGDKSK